MRIQQTARLLEPSRTRAGRLGEYHEGDHGIKPSAGLGCGTGRSMAGSGAGSGSGLGISFAVQCCCQEAAKGARCGGTSCSSSGCHRWGRGRGRDRIKGRVRVKGER
eukprot:scaffold18764_cov53-Phaeocystis_antarctica.AAC.9